MINDNEIEICLFPLKFPKLNDMCIKGVQAKHLHKYH